MLRKRWTKALWKAGMVAGLTMTVVGAAHAPGKPPGKSVEEKAIVATAQVLEKAVPTLEQRLALAAPTLDPTVLHLALRAMTCASKHFGERQKLVVVDYSLADTQRRLWVFDLRSGTLLYNEYALHGRGSGEGIYARRFSNTPDSNASSLGLFEIEHPFFSDHGPAMQLIGLEKGVNDHAEERDLWLHGTKYVDDVRATTGHVDHSQGCLAVQNKVIRPMIDSLKEGAWLFAYYPDSKWLSSSRFLKASMC